MTQLKVLIVESDAQLRSQISQSLMGEGYLTYESGQCKDALYLFNMYQIDLVVMDYLLPDGDGLSLCHHFLTTGSAAIILVSHCNDESTKMLAFGLGVEDYILKPFYSRELIARVKVILRRHSKKAPESILNLGPYTLKRKAKVVYHNHHPAQLSRREYDLFEHLMLNQNIVLSRQQLLESIWGIDYEGESRTVDSHIKKLRNKLDPDNSYIQTVWGIGYVMKK